MREMVPCIIEITEKFAQKHVNINAIHNGSSALQDEGGKHWLSASLSEAKE